MAGGTFHQAQNSWGKASYRWKSRILILFMGKFVACKIYKGVKWTYSCGDREFPQSIQKCDMSSCNIIIKHVPILRLLKMSK